MEEGTDEDIFYNPLHPYTMQLLKSVPRLGGKDSKQRLIPIKGTPPDMLNPPTGCPFYPRCELAMEICSTKTVPEFLESDSHKVKCWLRHGNAPKLEAYEAMKGGVLNG